VMYPSTDTANATNTLLMIRDPFGVPSRDLTSVTAQVPLGNPKC
jgi:hypothetical protein